MTERKKQAHLQSFKITLQEKRRFKKPNFSQDVNIKKDFVQRRNEGFAVCSGSGNDQVADLCK